MAARRAVTRKYGKTNANQALCVAEMLRCVSMGLSPEGAELTKVDPSDCQQAQLRRTSADGWPRRILRAAWLLLVVFAALFLFGWLAVWLALRPTP